MKRIFNKYLTIYMIALLALTSYSCGNKSYPCPGLGQSDAADLSMFGDDGELKSEFKKKKRGRIDKNTGIVSKKNPKKIRKPRRTQI
jgi:hypothetical protein